MLIHVVLNLIKTQVCFLFDSWSRQMIIFPQRSTFHSLFLWHLTPWWRMVRSQNLQGACPTYAATQWQSHVTTTTQQRTLLDRRSALNIWRNSWSVWERSWKQCSKSVGVRRDGWRDWRRLVRSMGPPAVFGEVYVILLKHIHHSLIGIEWHRGILKQLTDGLISAA